MKKSTYTFHAGRAGDGWQAVVKRNGTELYRSLRIHPDQERARIAARNNQKIKQWERYL